MVNIWDMGVSENVVCTPKPNGFHDHYPYQMAMSLGIYPIFRQTQIPRKSLGMDYHIVYYYNRV